MSFWDKWESFWSAVEESLHGDYDIPMTPPEQPLIAPDAQKQANTPTEPPTASGSLLERFCAAIIGHEGAVPENNNPFNCKFYYGGYLPIYGEVKCSVGGFAMFSTYALGYLYGVNTVKEIIRNHPGLTFLGFFEIFAPASDGNNPPGYSKIVATACGMQVDSLVNQILA